MASPAPLLLPPALPSELLAYILQHEAYPTTLIVCSRRADFLASLLDDAHAHAHAHQAPRRGGPPPPPHTPLQLSSALLCQVAVARHIRLVFVPTVSHLRAHLAVFSPSSPSSKVPPPPPQPQQQEEGEELGRIPRRQPPPLLLVYGFVALHRDTSEWSAQGVSASAAALVEASRTAGFRAVVVEPPPPPSSTTPPGLPQQQDDCAELPGEAQEGVAGGGAAAAASSGGAQMLAEQMPVLSTSVVRAGGDLEDAAWTGRKVTVGRVLGRWFRYKARRWSQQDAAEKSE